MVMQVILLPLFCSIIITNVAVVLSDSYSKLFLFYFDVPVSSWVWGAYSRD